MLFEKGIKIFKSILIASILLLAACAKNQEGEPVQMESQYGPFTMLQLTPLTPGEELAVLHTSMGDIKLRFFPEDAPKAVENFVTHAKNGYYDGVIFHRVLQEFMIQGGDPQGTGRGGESIWGGGFEYEFSLRLRHFRGALAMAHSSQPNSNGSQFYIVQNTQLNPSFIDLFESFRAQQDEVIQETEEGTVYLRDIMPLEVLDKFINEGGTPHLDTVTSQDPPNAHTVFGHVVEGMDVVDKIAAVAVNEDQTSEEYGRPLEPVLISSISFETAP
jgi:peptidyl-prolyl cis-trans isomerase B (cyclophilin B)